MRLLTETERAIEISIVCGISGEGDWEDDEKDVLLSVVGRRRESVEGEWWRGLGCRRGVVFDLDGKEGFLVMFSGRGIVWERTSCGCGCGASRIGDAVDSLIDKRGSLSSWILLLLLRAFSFALSA